MKLKSIIFFIIPAFIWGSTWYAIKFQLGHTDPLLSVGYRFGLASLVLIIYCVITQRKMIFPLKNHFYIAIQGFSLFGVNYWLVYLAEEHLTSGLVAVIFSTLIFSNIILSRLVLKMPLQRKVILGAIIGFTGMYLLFKDEIVFQYTDKSFIALLFGIGSVLLASFGNILSVANQKRKIPLVQNNAFGMLYGSMSVILIAWFSGKPFTIDVGLPYLASLGYLSLFGSVIAFSAYLKLIGEIGPDRGGYVAMVMPVVALTISTFLEDFNWTSTGIIGVLLIITGNALALIKVKRKRLAEYASQAS